MKQFLKKPLGLAVAATLAMGGMATYTNVSATTNADALGDAAIVPYFTVQDNFITGIQIINTSEFTQAVKVRLRRGSDSADILDFNLVMSPFDHWSGYVSKVGDAVIMHSEDNTCTAPQLSNGTFVSPVPELTANEDEGYIEIIGMGQTDGNQPIDVQAKHDSAGVPADCNTVEKNFLADNVITNAYTNTRGLTAAEDTNAATTAVPTTGNVWNDTQNVLKVSFFIRDATSGLEMGDNATHIVDFNGTDATPGNGGLPMMTNQEAGKGLANGFTAGFDFPDLDGGGSNGGGTNRGTLTGIYNGVIRADLGSKSIINNWSFNPANDVQTDWVVNVPGQYLMINPKGDQNAADAFDDSIQTDIPVTATLTYYDREEDEEAGGSVVVSPGIPGGKTTLPGEVNVIEWGGKTVFNSDLAISARPDQSGINQPFGWAALTLASATNPNGADTNPATDKGTVIYDLTNRTGGGNTSATALNRVPVISFAGWLRKFDGDSNRNYGRMVGASRTKGQ